MIKKISILAVLVTVINASLFAQYQREDEPETSKGFKKQNFFTGGNVTVSFYSGGTVLGLSPYFGYSLNKFIDVAASLNFNYISQRDYYTYGDKLRQTVYGPGGFVRLFPLKFLFGQAQYEHNFIKLKYYPVQGGYIVPDTKYDANSVLLGGGYCSGRQGTGNIFYYFSVMWDVSRVAESPYVDGLGRNFPIIKAGLQIPLFQRAGKNRD